MKNSGQKTEFTDLEKKIIAAIENLDKEVPTGNDLVTRTGWTKAVKEILKEIGVENEYKTATSGINADWGEWLYDLVWYKDNGEKGSAERLHEVGLVMEIEWNPEIPGLLLDFTKLLLAHVPTRVFLCNQKDKNDAERIEQVLEESIVAFKENLPPNFRCLLLVFLRNEPLYIKNIPNRNLK